MNNIQWYWRSNVFSWIWIESNSISIQRKNRNDLNINYDLFSCTVQFYKFLFTEHQFPVYIDQSQNQSNYFCIDSTVISIVFEPQIEKNHCTSSISMFSVQLSVQLISRPNQSGDNKRWMDGTHGVKYIDNNNNVKKRTSLKLYRISRWVSKIIIWYGIRESITYLMGGSNMLVPDRPFSSQFLSITMVNKSVRSKRRKKMVRDAINGFSKFTARYGLVILDLFIGFDIVSLCRFIVAYNLDINWKLNAGRRTRDIELLLSFAVFHMQLSLSKSKVQGILCISPIFLIYNIQNEWFEFWMPPTECMVLLYSSIFVHVWSS